MICFLSIFANNFNLFNQNYLSFHFIYDFENSLILFCFNVLINVSTIEAYKQFIYLNHSIVKASTILFYEAKVVVLIIFKVTFI